MACTNIRFGMMWLSKPVNSLRYCFLLLVVGGYFYDYRSHGCADYLPGILGFHDDEHVARPHLFCTLGRRLLLFSSSFSTLLVDGVEKQS